MAKLSDSWKAIDPLWERIEIAFKIARLLSGIDRLLAKKYAESAAELRHNAYPESAITADAVFNCLDSSIRAYVGLLASGTASEEDLRQLLTAIEALSSAGHRSMFLGELAMRLYLNKKTEEADRIVERGVIRALGEIDQRAQAWWRQVVISVSPALYRFDESIAAEYLKALPRIKRDDAYVNIARFLLLKISPNEPLMGDPMRNTELALKDAWKIGNILGLIKGDSEFLNVLEDLSEALENKRNRENFSRLDYEGLLDKIDLAISSNLPDVYNIRHDGYVIAAKAIILRLRKSPLSAWEGLLSDARAISNESDRAFVLALIAHSMAKKFHDRSLAIFSEAAELSEGLFATLDKCSRFKNLASEICRIDPSRCRQFLRRAMEISFDDESESIVNIRKSIVSRAHEICPEVVDGLISLSESQGVASAGRTRDSMRVKRQDNFLKLVKELKNIDYSNIELDRTQELRLPEAAFRLLGSLNARRMSPYRIDRNSFFLDAAENRPVTEIAPIFSLIVENAVQLCGKTGDAESFVRPAFGVFLQGVELIRAISICAGRVDKNLHSPQRIELSSSFVVRAGNREAGLEFISKWLRGNLGGYLKICDPYFGVDDLEILKLVHRVNPSCLIKILTGERHQISAGTPMGYDIYRSAWRSISDQDPPEAQIFMVGLKSSGASPIHDRWWLTDGAGLRLGTSFNSLGVKRDSELSYMNIDEARACEAEVDLLFSMTKKEHQGDKLCYSMFTLH